VVTKFAPIIRRKWKNGPDVNLELKPVGNAKDHRPGDGVVAKSAGMYAWEGLQDLF
jgi:hypothetical protein